MKSLILIAFLFFGLCISAQAQNPKPKEAPEPTQPEIEKFSSQFGSLLQREFYDIGAVRDVKVKLLYIQNLQTKKTSLGLRVDREINGGRTAISYLDLDELDALIKAVRQIKQIMAEQKPTVYTEISYTSISRFEIGCFYGDQRWHPYLHVSLIDRNDYLWMKESDVAEFLTVLETAKSRVKY